MPLNEPPETTASDPVASLHLRSGDAWSAWLAGSAGGYLLGWEQLIVDEWVSDVFGFNAIQCGTPQLDGLRANRMPLRCVVLDQGHSGLSGVLGDEKPVLIDQYEALPFESQSIDLLVLPHVLEFSEHPHQMLREVERVLRPEGKVVIFGLNPFSLWGARHALAGWFFKARLPAQTRMISLSRLRDWLKLLEIEVDRVAFGCYRPMAYSDSGLKRSKVFESLGDRLWPVCGAAYCVTAVKRVHGMRLIGPAWKAQRLRGKAVAAPGVQGRAVADEPRRIRADETLQSLPVAALPAARGEESASQV